MKILLLPIATILLTILAFIGLPLKWLYRCNLYLFKVASNISMWSIGCSDRLTLDFSKPLQWVKKKVEV